MPSLSASQIQIAYILTQVKSIPAVFENNEHLKERGLSGIITSWISLWHNWSLLCSALTLSNLPLPSISTTQDKLAYCLEN